VNVLSVFAHPDSRQAIAQQVAAEVDRMIDSQAWGRWSQLASLGAR
jgi:hypothetical protein